MLPFSDYCAAYIKNKYDTLCLLGMCWISVKCSCHTFPPIKESLNAALGIVKWLF